MVQPFEFPTSLNRDQVNRLLHYTDQRRISRLVLTHRTTRIITQEKALLTQTNLASGLMKRVTERSSEITIVRDKVIREPSRGFLSD